MPADSPCRVRARAGCWACCSPPGRAGPRGTSSSAASRRRSAHRPGGAGGRTPATARALLRGPTGGPDRVDLGRGTRPKELRPQRRRWPLRSAVEALQDEGRAGAVGEQRRERQAGDEPERRTPGRADRRGRSAGSPGVRRTAAVLGQRLPQRRGRPPTRARTGRTRARRSAAPRRPRQHQPAEAWREDGADAGDQHQAGEQRGGAMPENRSRTMAIDTTATAAPAWPCLSREAVGRPMLGASAQSTDAREVRDDPGDAGVGGGRGRRRAAR